MAFFKFRKGGEDQPTPATGAPESVEALRKRAMHRLIGAALLVILGVIGFPLLFDSQPRPISVDIPIEIPDKNKVKPLGNLPIEVVPAQAGGVVEPPVTLPVTPPVPATPSPAPSSAAVPSSAPASSPVVAPAPASASASAPKPVVSATEPAASAPKVPAPAKPVPIATAPVKTDDGSKAQALLEGKEAQTKLVQAPAVAADARFVVQVGAFADAVKAREARAKLEKAGLKTYTQVAETKEGRRIRVRVGPFATRAEAEKTTEKIKKLDFAASILEL